MQASTVSPVTNTTVASNTTAVTKSKEQILIQSSGAMIAVIVVGIIIILALLLIILKTYNRRTHASRVLGTNSGSKPRKKTSQSTFQSSLPLSNLGVNSATGSLTNSIPASENGFQLPRMELNGMEGHHLPRMELNGTAGHHLPRMELNGMEGHHLPEMELSSVEGNHIEQFSTTSDSTVVTIHEIPSHGDT